MPDAPDRLSVAWDNHAADWVRWVRSNDNGAYLRYHRDRFLSLLPEPGTLTVDVGCGEGRLARDLLGLGHRVVALDASPTLVAHVGAGIPAVVADAAALPLRDGCADLVVAFMALHDVDDMRGAVAEAARVLRPGGALCLAIVHPVSSAGRFDGGPRDGAAPFVITGSYLDEWRYAVTLDRGEGRTMTFHSVHRPMSAYVDALHDAGLRIDALREVGEVGTASRWARIPAFLHVRASR